MSIVNDENPSKGIFRKDTFGGICVGIISVVLFPAGIMTAFPRRCVFSVSCYFRVTSTGQWSDPKISV